MNNETKYYWKTTTGMYITDGSNKTTVVKLSNAVTKRTLQMTTREAIELIRDLGLEYSSFRQETI